MGAKMAASFADIFMAEIETRLIHQSETKPREWKRYVDDVFSHRDCDKKEVDRFIKRANYFHPTIKFTAEISENQITFLDTTVFKGERFAKYSILDITFCHPPGIKYGFIKGEAMRLLRTNSSKKAFEEGRLKFKQRLIDGGYPENIIERSLSGVNFASWQLALRHAQKPKGHERLLPFVTTYHPAVKNLKQIIMEYRSLIHNQPLLKTNYTKPPISSYKKGKSL